MALVISDKYKYIFFHIPKNAGVSVSTYLINQEYRLFFKKFLIYVNSFIFGKQNNFYLTKDLKFIKFNSHISCGDFFEKFENDLFKEYFKFAIVRNPYDRFVSRYEYSKKINKKFRKMDFDTFLNFDIENNIKVLNQFNFCSDNSSNLLLDKIIKFENLENDLNEITKNIFNNKINLSHMNKTSRKNYRDYYNFNTKKIVEQNFKKDLEYFDYRF